ncbi:hypothetical protein PoB_007124500 [Plakobranchus ocellatus]|uniref:Uncharacterized protein n=1 Tax=Plakobranchus ocellatus TaxID=259542 RepID=A0AAV4DKS6_9GAST|nr:hypothetical protein PoB_007124500 [Plakobranchus ocellatus]
MVKSLNGEDDSSEYPIILEKDEETLTGKRAVNNLRQHCKSMRSMDIKEERINQILKETESMRKEITKPFDICLDTKILTQKLDNALTQLKSKQAPARTKYPTKC